MRPEANGLDQRSYLPQYDLIGLNGSVRALCKSTVYYLCIIVLILLLYTYNINTNTHVLKLEPELQCATGATTGGHRNIPREGGTRRNAQRPRATLNYNYRAYHTTNRGGHNGRSRRAPQGTALPY